ncbi:hypothetical protein ACFL3M_01790 [Patescibacteria group bacterium]
MTWVIVSLCAYFLFSVSSVLDKLLLKKRIPNPSTYAFYIALFGLGAFIVIPFQKIFPGVLDSHFELIGTGQLLLSLVSGIFFVYALFFLFSAVKRSEVSRAASLVLVFIQVFSFLILLLFNPGDFDLIKATGFFLLLVGGLFISFDLPIKSLKIFSGFKSAFLSGMFFAVAYSLFGDIYGNVGFVSGFIWTRVGIFLAGLSLFLFSGFRREIVDSVNVKKDRSESVQSHWFTVFVFLLNKLSSSVGSILMNYAFVLGSVAYVQAIGSAQFVFILLLASIASIRRPDIFEEKMYFWDWLQKIVSILIIACGVILISI